MFLGTGVKSEEDMGDFVRNTIRLSKQAIGAGCPAHTGSKAERCPETTRCCGVALQKPLQIVFFMVTGHFQGVG
jgi:hypothetical protein